MGRQILLFTIVCAVSALLLRDTHSEFLEIWLTMKPDGHVTRDDYDSLWAQFMLPRIALFSLVLSSVIILGALGSDMNRPRRNTPRRRFRSIRQLCVSLQQ